MCTLISQTLKTHHQIAKTVTSAEFSFQHREGVLQWYPGNKANDSRTVSPLWPLDTESAGSPPSSQGWKRLYLFLLLLCSDFFFSTWVHAFPKFTFAYISRKKETYANAYRSFFPPSISSSPSPTHTLALHSSFDVYSQCGDSKVGSIKPYCCCFIAYVFHLAIL